MKRPTNKNAPAKISAREPAAAKRDSAKTGEAKAARSRPARSEKAEAHNGGVLSGILPGGAMKALMRFVWKVSGRDQIFLSILSIAVFAVDLVPLELQRRITNAAVKGHEFQIIFLLCMVYVAAVVSLGLLKLWLNVYRGQVGERVNRLLRLDHNLIEKVKTESRGKPEDEGVAVSIVVSEIDAVGGFVGTCASEPVLNGGILLSVFGYMLYMQPMMALVAVALFASQAAFIPLMQNAINMRTKKRIKRMRELGTDIVEESHDPAGAREKGYRKRVNRVYELNMQIFRRKFGMNFLMNLFFQFGIIGILLVGGWFMTEGKTEIGTVVAFISGLNRMNDPWGDLVNYFRDLTNAAVKYRLIAHVFEGKEDKVSKASKTQSA